MNTNEKTLSELRDAMTFLTPSHGFGVDQQRAKDCISQAITTITSQPSPDLVGEIDLTLDSDAIEAAREFLGESDAEYLLGEINDILARRLAAKGGAVSATEVHVALCNAWDAVPGQDNFADPETIRLQTEAVMRLIHTSIPAVERVSREAIEDCILDTIREATGEDPSMDDEADAWLFSTKIYALLQLPAAQVSGVEEAIGLLRNLTPEEPCRYDHNGNCQEHSWFGLNGEKCPVEKAKEFLNGR